MICLCTHVLAKPTPQEKAPSIVTCTRTRVLANLLFTIPLRKGLENLAKLVPATKSALRGSQSVAAATKSALRGSQNAAPATKSSHHECHRAALPRRFAARALNDNYTMKVPSAVLARDFFRFLKTSHVSQGTIHCTDHEFRERRRSPPCPKHRACHEIWTSKNHRPDLLHLP